MEDKRYSLRIGRFDHKLGPICVIFRENIGKYCDFSGQQCTGSLTPVFRDAILSQQQILFEDEIGFFQVIKIPVERPEKRGRIERYIILIKISKGLGKIKDQILNKIRSEFLSLFRTPQYEPSSGEFQKFISNWEENLRTAINASDIGDIMHQYRDKLNIATGYIQILLMDTENVFPELYKEFLNETLIILFEIESLLKPDEIKKSSVNGSITLQNIGV